MTPPEPRTARPEADSGRDWRDTAGTAETRILPVQSGRAESPAPERDVFEIDLSGELDDLLSAAAAPEQPIETPAEAHGHPGGLDGFFGELREERGRDLQGVSAALAYDQASEHFNRGEIDEAADCLKSAARDPMFRFRAASMLARIARDRRRFGEAVEWLERAAEAPAPTTEASHSLLYELGDILEATREDTRALAVFIELQAAAPGYRDVADRVAGLVAPSGRP